MKERERNEAKIKKNEGRRGEKLQTLTQRARVAGPANQFAASTENFMVSK